jgi:hypothetical protein
MANVSEEFENWSSAKTFLSVLLLLVLLAAGLGWGQTRLRSVPGGGVGILDSNLYYTGDQAYHHLDSLGEDGRKIYKGLLFLDLLLSILYSSRSRSDSPGNSSFPGKNACGNWCPLFSSLRSSTGWRTSAFW